MQSHYILLAHGSKDPLWCQTLAEGLESMRESLTQPVSLAYMELASPSLEELVESRYQFGDRHFTVLPLFFAAGRHLLVDVPAQLQALKQHYGDTEFVLNEPLGKDHTFWQFLAASINQQLSVEPEQKT